MKKLVSGNNGKELQKNEKKLVVCVTGTSQVVK
jgi:hypothetical protein